MGFVTLTEEDEMLGPSLVVAPTDRLEVCGLWHQCMSPSAIGNSVRNTVIPISCSSTMCV